MLIKKLTFMFLLALAGLQLSAQMLQLEKPDNLIHISSKLENGMRDFAFSILSDFQCSVETWNTGCGLDNGKLITNIYYGQMPYHVVIFRNSDNKKLFDQWIYYSRVQLDDLRADGYEVIVDDSNKPVPNNYTLFAAEVKTSSSPVLSIVKYPEHCNDGKGSIQASAQSGVGPYEFKLMNTGEKNNTGKFTNLKSETYTIQVSDANFCTDVESVLISNHCDSIFSKNILQKNTCDSLKSVKLDTVKSGKAWGTNTDSFTITKYNFIPKFTNVILGSSSCNPSDTGLHFLGKYHNQYGCDSIVWKMVGYAPKGVFTFDTIKTVCISDSGRVEVFKGKSSAGCDSTYTKSWDYIGIQTIYMPTRDTCNASPDKVDTVKSKVCLLSDSIYYITHFNFISVRDTIIYQDVCDLKLKNKRDTTITLLYGCKKQQVIVYLYHTPKYTSLSPRYECGPGKNYIDTIIAGADYRFGCDSFTTQSIRFVKPDTIYNVVYACRVYGSGHFQFKGMNRFNCDSTFIQDTFAYPSAVSQEFVNTCDKNAKKIDTTFRGKTIFGCDTFHILFNTILKPSFGKVRQGICKEPLLPKNDTVLFTVPNSVGCDSFSVIEFYFYPETIPTEITDSICGVKRSETISEITLQNQYGCDSIVRQKLVEFPSPILKKEYLKDNSAIYSWDGEIRVSASGGTAPYTFTWNDGEVGPWRRNLKGGDYSVTLTDKNGCPDSMNFTVLYFWVHPTQSVREVLAEGYFANCDQARLTFFNTEGHKIGSVEVDATNKIEVLQKIDISGVVVVRAECISGIDTGKFLKTKSTFVR